MKLRIKNLMCVIFGICIACFVGCANAKQVQETDAKQTQAANEMHFDMNDISDVEIAYDEETITFFPSEGKEMIIKEFMSKNKDTYYASVKKNAGSIQVREGGKPIIKNGFSRYVEVYFPENYEGNLTVTTTNGKIDFTNIEMNLTLLYACSTSGILDLGEITGQQIVLETTSGTVECEKLCGDVTYTTTSGNLNVKSAVGSGTYRANNSGELNVIYTEVLGELAFYDKNGNIELTLPKNLDFLFEATTKNGTVATSFQESISTEGRITRASIGNDPLITVKVETNNGDIRVN